MAKCSPSYESEQPRGDQCYQTIFHLPLKETLVSLTTTVIFLNNFLSDEHCHYKLLLIQGSDESDISKKLDLSRRESKNGETNGV